MVGFYNWWTDVLLTFVVVGFLIANWLDWGFVYKSYSPFKWPRNNQYTVVLLIIVIIGLIGGGIVLYPH